MIAVRQAESDARLGYVVRSRCVSVRGPLPLRP